MAQRLLERERKFLALKGQHYKIHEGTLQKQKSANDEIPRRQGRYIPRRSSSDSLSDDGIDSSMPSLGNKSLASWVRMSMSFLR